MIASFKPNTTKEITILREGKEKKLEVKLGTLPVEISRVRERKAPSPFDFGW